MEGVGSMEMASAKVWSVADLADLPNDGNRYEVIDGELHVTPAPTWDHQRAVMRLFTLLAPYVERERIGEVIVAPADVAFSDESVVQPDLFVVPLLAAGRAMWEFFGERVQFEPWKEETVPVEVEVEDERHVKPVPPEEEPPEAKVAP